MTLRSFLRYSLGILFALHLHAGHLAPEAAPSAMIDLATREGVSLVHGQWRYSDVKIVDTTFFEPGPDGQPSTTPNRTYDYQPHAGGADFNDSAWTVIDPTTLSQRRGAGRLSFAWYRITLTVPDHVDGFDTTHSSVVFETSLDDYAEIWVDGELTRSLGQSGGSVIAGWNAENRLLIGRDVKPGQRITLAIFGANGPLSNPPTNYIYLRHARLLFFASAQPGPAAIVPAEVNVEVIRKDPALDRIISANPKIHKLADGFQFTEGPVWNQKAGYLFFSDPNANTIYKYVPRADDQPGDLQIFRRPSGYAGADVAEYGQPGSNGLTLDPAGRLTVNEHGNHRVSRLEPNGQWQVLADNYQGKRLNSPNDLVYRSDGALFFTDPPFGLPRFFEDPRKQLPYSGVFSWTSGVLRLLSTDLAGPNGIAFSPDEQYLYVTNWDPQKKVIMRYRVAPDTTLSQGEIFFDMTAAPGDDALDGLKVDREGNLYVSGPGGLWIISPQGRHLGTVIGPKHPHNLAWGDADGKTLYLCAQSGLYRMRVGIPGIRP